MSTPLLANVCLHYVFDVVGRPLEKVDTRQRLPTLHCVGWQSGATLASAQPGGLG